MDLAARKQSTAGQPMELACGFLFGKGPIPVSGNAIAHPDSKHDLTNWINKAV
jgi:hypothetical protein